MDVAVAHPERQLGIAHAPRFARDSLTTLFALDERLGSLMARAREPAIGLMRLVWWRDALEALDRQPPPGEPLLHAAAALRPDRISGAELAAMVEGWAALLDDPDWDDETAMIHAHQRGARFFGLAARILGHEQALPEGAGEGWALADLARHSRETSRACGLLDLAREPLGRAMAGRWPHALRPLGMLTALAWQDVRRGGEAMAPPGSRGRLLRMLAHRWTGR